MDFFSKILGIPVIPCKCKLFLQHLLVRTINFPVVDLIDDVMGRHAVDCATHGLGDPQNLLHHPGEVLGHGPGPHDAGGVDDVVQTHVAAVFDVLDLLPVPGRLLEGLDDEGGGGGDHGHGGLAVLDLELHGHLQTLPVRRVLGDVVSDLPEGEAEGTTGWEMLYLALVYIYFIHLTKMFTDIDNSRGDLQGSFNLAGQFWLKRDNVANFLNSQKWTRMLIKTPGSLEILKLTFLGVNLVHFTDLSFALNLLIRCTRLP